MRDRHNGNRKNIEVDDQEIENTLMESNFVNGWAERQGLEECLNLAAGTLRGDNDTSSKIIKTCFYLTKKISDINKNSKSVAEKLNGFYMDLKINSQSCRIISNAEMLDNSGSAEQYMTPKRLTAIMTEVLIEFVKTHQILILRVIGVTWDRPEGSNDNAAPNQSSLVYV